MDTSDGTNGTLLWMGRCIPERNWFARCWDCGSVNDLGEGATDWAAEHVRATGHAVTLYQTVYWTVIPEESEYPHGGSARADLPAPPQIPGAIRAAGHGEEAGDV